MVLQMMSRKEKAFFRSPKCLAIKTALMPCPAAAQHSHILLQSSEILAAHFSANRTSKAAQLGFQVFLTNQESWNPTRILLYIYIQRHLCRGGTETLQTYHSPGKSKILQKITVGLLCLPPPCQHRVQNPDHGQHSQQQASISALLTSPFAF